MKKFVVVAALLLSYLSNAQNAEPQYSIEAMYGMNSATPPTIQGFSHFDIGARYMWDELWGVKVSYGHDKFDPSLPANGGTTYSRFSVEGVHNLGRTLMVPDYTNGYGNLLAHAGLGYSALTSNINDGVDNIGNVIVGLTPQIYITEQLTFNLDASFILNVTQHFNFDGTYPNNADNAQMSFNGKMFNLSAGFTFYLGKGRSDNDWR